MSDSITVEVAYALPDRQELVRVVLAAGSTVAQAIQASGLLAKYTEIDLAANPVGIYGKLSNLDAVLRDRDRVEIYRPLKADPEEVRRQLARIGKTMRKKSGGAESER